MLIVMYVFSLLFGLVIGSFLNVVIYRLPRHESLSRPGSHCPGCGTPIHWYDNIPVVSWIVLRGRCRSCNSRISPRYPAVEGMTGVAFVLAFWRFGLEWQLLVAWAFVAAAIAVAFIDYDRMIIPDKIVVPGAVLGLAASIALSPARWWVYVAGGLGAAAFMFLLIMLWPGGMGAGDMKMALFMGAVLGSGVTVALFSAFLFGSLVGLAMIVILKRSRKTKLPFGPFLSMGAMLALFVGDIVVKNYLSLFN